MEPPERSRRADEGDVSSGAVTATASPMVMKRSGTEPRGSVDKRSMRCPHQIIARFAVISSVFAGLAGCGGDPGSPPDDQASDRAAAEGELGRVTQALGEATCGSTPADAVLDPNGQPAFSPNGGYDHPTCRNGFVVDAPGIRAGRQFVGGPSLVRWPDPFTCLFQWGYLSLWLKQPTGAYTKVAESSRLGVWIPITRVGYVCDSRVGLQASADGDYKLVSAAGVLFGPYNPVVVY